MTDIHANFDKRWVLLTLRRLPARVNVEQSAVVLGFQPHDIPLLVRNGLLKPLGNGPKNSVKYFSSVEIQSASQVRKWLDKATRAVSRCKPTKSQAGESAEQEAFS